MKKTTLILVLIILLGTFLRFHSLTNNPPSLYWDEVSIGYNAYSIVHTLKDEWGKTTPLFFEAFGEFKFPVAIYLTAISVKVFGLSDFAVRFPSAFLGVLSGGAMYFLGIQIFKKRKIALLSAFIFCVSPWSIQFSRGMFESNISVFFLTLAVYFLILFSKKRRWSLFFYYIIAAFLCIYSYATMLVILPLLSVLTIFIFLPSNVNEKIKIAFILSVVFLILYNPFLLHIKNDSYLRFNQVSIFSQNPVLEKVINLRVKYGALSGIIFNKYAAALINFGNNFITYINPQFLWPGKDGNPRHSNGFGLIYPIEFIFLVLGAVYLFLSERKVLAYLLLFLFAPFAVSSFTKDSPHALRSLSSIMPLSLIFAYGIYFFSKKKAIKILTIFSYLIFMIFYLGKYYDSSFKSFSAWGMENKLMMEEAKKLNTKNKIVYFTGDYWRSYIYYYYYFSIPSFLVQKNNNSTKIGNVYFGYAKWDKADRRYDFNFKPESLFSKENYVLFLSASEKAYFNKMLEKKNAHLLKDFYYNNSYIFSIYEK